MPDDGRQFVDTNIFVYAYDLSDERKRSRAQDVLYELWASRQGCISVQVLQELYVVLTTRVPKPLSSAAAGRIVADLGAWRLHVPDLNAVLDAIDIQTRNRMSFWDAMIVCSARQLDCRTIWTEDLSAGQEYEGIKVVNPFAD